MEKLTEKGIFAGTPAGTLGRPARFQKCYVDFLFGAVYTQLSFFAYSFPESAKNRQRPNFQENP